MAKKRRIIKVGQESGEKDLSDRVAQYDPSVAVHYGQFVEIAYRMYESTPNNPTPNPPSPFPVGYKFLAWIQMNDFIIVGGNWTFYGFIAQSTVDPNKFILAIRGTETLEEWWDDLTSVVLVPCERMPVLDKADAIAALPESVKAYFRMDGRMSNCDVRWYMNRFPAFNKLEDSERRAIADKLIRDMLQRGELIKVKCKRDVYEIATETAPTPA